MTRPLESLRPGTGLGDSKGAVGIGKRYRGVPAQ